MEHEDFVTYEQAKKLKKLGFDWKCNHFYDASNEQLNLRRRYYDSNHDGIYDDTSAPTLAQAQKWLREVKEIEVGVFADFDIELPNGKWMWLMRKFNTHLYDTVFPEDNINYGSYEQALSAGIDAVLELLKQN